MKIAVVICVSTFAMGACANMERAATANRAQTEMVGMAKRDLLLCAGVPNRQQTEGDLEFLTYSGGGDSASVGIAKTNSPNTAVGVAATQHRYCEATFVLQNGIVQKVNYSGRTGGFASIGEQCAFIVENCVRP